MVSDPQQILPTPGSFTVKGPSAPTADNPEGGDFAILDSAGQIIAETFRRVCPGEAGLRPAEANARLFSASRDLLNTSIEAAGGLAACAEIMTNLGHPTTAAKLLEIQARQLMAIARATGSAV